MTRHASTRITLADCCSAFASTRPPSLPQTRAWHRAADRLLDLTRPSLVPLMIALSVATSLASNVLPERFAMLPLGAFFLVVGGWCDLNLVRSREAHCLVTGIGWTALAILALVAALVGANWHDGLSRGFLLVLAGSVVFELAWAARSGSTALDRHPGATS